MANRQANAKRNLISGFFLRIIIMVFPFINRTLILYILGAEYQGLSSLFSSILQVLNLADLGFSSAIIFALYKPIAENDIKKVNAYVSYIKNAYRIVGFVIIGIGAVLMPLLPFMIKGSYPEKINLYLLYSIYLCDAGISYLLFAYKNSLLIAEQRIDIVNKITSTTTVIRYLAQFALLYITKNYYLYIAVTPIFTVVSSLLTQYFSRKLFRDVKPEGKIDESDQKALNKQLKGIIVGKVSDVARNSFDSIILSSLLGLVVVAIYNNYYYIYTTIYGFVLILAHAIQAGVGDSIARESVDKNYDDLNKLNFISNWMSGICSICLLCLYQPFMRIWVGDDLLLDDFNMVLFCVYFYAINMNNIRNEYLNGCGLWWENKQWFIIEAFGNLAFNVILGIYFGVTGVLMATIITIVLFNYLARTNNLFRHYFKRSPKEFYKNQIIFTVVNCAVGALTYLACSFIVIGGVWGLAAKLLACMVLSNAMYIICYHRSRYFSYAKALVTAYLPIKRK